MCLGVPGKIVEIADRERLPAVADVSGVRRKVNVTCVVDEAHPIDACIGDWVLIHVGFAMARIDEHEAAETSGARRDGRAAGGDGGHAAFGRAPGSGATP